MDIKRSKRILVKLEAEIISEGINYTGFIGNLSEEGAFMSIAPVKNALNFNPGSEVMLKFQIPSGEILTLPCSISWTRKTMPENRSINIGMKIIDSPTKYKEFLAGRVDY